jgi:hypothetical protein
MATKTNPLTEVTKLTENPLEIEQNAAQVLDAFDKVPTSSLQQLNSEYLKLEENSSYSYIFTGMTTLKGKEGSNDAEREYEGVKLVDREGKNYVSGLTVLVTELKKVTVLPCLVKIVTKKETKSSSGMGKYLAMEVYTVPMPLAK